MDHFHAWHIQWVKTQGIILATQQEVIFLKSNPRVYDATLETGCGYNEIVISYNEI